MLPVKKPAQMVRKKYRAAFDYPNTVRAQLP
jgi:hypothetical protein